MHLKDIWWILLLQGLLLIVFGVITIAWTPMSFLILSIIVSLYFLIAGVLNIVRGVVTMHTNRYWFMTLLIGLLEVGVGIYGLSRPLVSLLTFVIVISIALILRGIFEIIVAFERTHTTLAKILLIIIAAIQILAGILILRYPIAGGLAFVWVLGAMALVTGPILIALAIGARELSEELFAPKRVTVK